MIGGGAATVLEPSGRPAVLSHGHDRVRAVVPTQYCTRRPTVKLHAPSRGWFIASLVIAVIAVLSVLTPIPNLTAYGAWVAILAYLVLAVGNLA